MGPAHPFQNVEYTIQDVSPHGLLVGSTTGLVMVVNMPEVNTDEDSSQPKDIYFVSKIKSLECVHFWLVRISSDIPLPNGIKQKIDF